MPFHVQLSLKKVAAFTPAQRLQANPISTVGLHLADPSQVPSVHSAMQAPGLSSTPFTRLLLLFIPTSSVLTTALALKPYIPIHPNPHLYPFFQFWRIATYQSAYLTSSEVLFACVLIYNLRVLERLFGTRKYVSAVVVLGFWQAVVAVLLTSVLQIFTLGAWGYLPGGVTGVVLGLLAMYKEAVPSCWRWRVRLTGGEETGNGGGKRLVFSDKSTVYLIAVQLACCQFPWGLPVAAVGWVLGLLWRTEVLPGSGWRVPAWVVGESEFGVGGMGRKREFEGLRRRLEDESRAERERDMGVATSVDDLRDQQDTGRRRGVLRQVGDFFRGAV